MASKSLVTVPKRVAAIADSQHLVCLCSRARAEFLREQLRQANQIRGGSSLLGGPDGSTATMSEEAWLAAVRSGQKKAGVLRTANATLQVCWAANQWLSSGSQQLCMGSTLLRKPVVDDQKQD